MIAAAVDPAALAPVAVVLAAMGGLLKVVLDYLQRVEAKHEEALTIREAKSVEELAIRDKQWQGALAEHRKATEVFLGNHMSGNTRAMEAMVTALESLTASVDVMSGDAGGED